jgi:hypothetical protein
MAVCEAIIKKEASKAEIRLDFIHIPIKKSFIQTEASI